MREIEVRMGHLSYQLRKSISLRPKNFALQEQADRYRQQLRAHRDLNLETSLNETQAKIQECLLPVQWLNVTRETVYENFSF